MRCDNCDKDLTNKTVIFLPYGGKIYHVCDEFCEEDLISSLEDEEQHYQDLYQEFYEEMCKEAVDEEDLDSRLKKQVWR